MDAAEVLRLARLAKLATISESNDFSPEVLQTLARDLERILEHVAVLAEVDTKNVAPTQHGYPVPAKMAPDLVGPPWPREEALAAFPERQGDALRVPKVIE